MSDNELIPAATVLLVRDGAEGLEVLMLRRNSKIAFGGAWVFPGGAVEPDDRTTAEATVAATVDGDGSDGDAVKAAARVAAVRETDEETGLQIGHDDLELWSYWEPPGRPTMQGKGPVRRFSTWFFVSPAPDGDVAIDGGEIHEHRWLRPADALDLRRVGEIELVPPTWVTLTQLGAHDTVAAALEWARLTTSMEFRTRPINRAPLTLAWAGDAAYDGGPIDAAGPRHRLTMADDDWVYERRS
ncbi:MAG: NUDIX hydrolase [Actinomycetota bacterium]